MLQGLVVAVVSSSVVVALTTNKVFSPELIFGGMFVWAVGFYFESVSDSQLDAFLQDEMNKGKIMQSGLWKYSRHPNYFGESLMWFGLWITAVGHTPFAILCIVSPLLITFLLLEVSGVPLLEKRWEGRADWEEYKKKTPVFIPFLR